MQNPAKSLKETNHILTNAILAAVTAAIPRGARRDPKAWWTEEVKEAMSKRDHLRALASTDPATGAEWRHAEKATRDIIMKFNISTHTWCILTIQKAVNSLHSVVRIPYGETVLSIHHHLQ